LRYSAPSARITLAQFQAGVRTFKPKHHVR
jgi:hypothetical protein